MANGFAVIIKGLIFGVIFLMIWQITKINIGIWGIVIFFAIILLAILLSVFSLTSKLPTLKSIIWTIAWAVVILIVISAIGSLLYHYGDEDFKSGRKKKGYSYIGDYTIKNEALEFNKTLLISNRVNREYKYYNLYVIEGKGTVEITVGNYEFPPIPFSKNRKIVVGFKSWAPSSRKPQMWVNDHKKNFENIYLNLDNPHSVKMSLYCASNKCIVDDIFLGN